MKRTVTPRFLLASAAAATVLFATVCFGVTAGAQAGAATSERTSAADPLAPVKQNPGPRTLRVRLIAPAGASLPSPSTIGQQVTSGLLPLNRAGSGAAFTYAGMLPTLTSTADCASQRAAGAAASAGDTAGKGQYVMYLLSATDCPWLGWGSYDEPVTFVSEVTEAGVPDVGVFTHELGHNLRLPHAMGYWCPAMVPYENLPSDCFVNEYGDRSDLMGSTVDGQHYGFSAVGAALLGVGDKLIPVTVAERSVTRTVVPVALPGRPDGLRVRTPEAEYVVSLRQDVGPNLSDSGLPGTLTGVTVHKLLPWVSREDPRSTLYPHTFEQFAGGVGAHWLFEDGAFSVRVNRVDDRGASVTVTHASAGADGYSPIAVEQPSVEPYYYGYNVDPGQWLDASGVATWSAVVRVPTGDGKFKTMTIDERPMWESPAFLLTKVAPQKGRFTVTDVKGNRAVLNVTFAQAP